MTCARSLRASSLRSDSLRSKSPSTAAGSSATRATIFAFSASSSRIKTSSPATAQPNSLMFSGSMPASQSSCCEPGVTERRDADHARGSHDPVG